MQELLAGLERPLLLPVAPRGRGRRRGEGVVAPADQGGAQGAADFVADLLPKEIEDAAEFLEFLNSVFGHRNIDQNPESKVHREYFRVFNF